VLPEQVFIVFYDPDRIIAGPTVPDDVIEIKLSALGKQVPSMNSPWLNDGVTMEMTSSCCSRTLISQQHLVFKPKSGRLTQRNEGSGYA
jgi:hypothetical protein